MFVLLQIKNPRGVRVVVVPRYLLGQSVYIEFDLLAFSLDDTCPIIFPSDQGP